MKKTILILLLVIPLMGLCQDTLVKWTFPTNTSDTADGGIAANLHMIVTVQGNTSAMALMTGATTYCASATKWNNGNGTDYWQIKCVSLGYNNLTISSKQYSSPTGPRDFKVQFMIGYTGSWTDFPGDTITVANNWTSGVVSNVALPSACNNQDTVYIRWIMRSDTAVSGALVSSLGTSKIDDIYIKSSFMPPPAYPYVTNAFATDLLHVTVAFNKAVNPTAENVSNYTGLGTLTSAIRNTLLDTVTLTLQTPLQYGVTDTLTISNIADTLDSLMTAPQHFPIVLYNPAVEITITEIMYNPPESGTDSLEFLELRNNSHAAANIGNCRINSGVIYTFPPNTILGPRAYVVLAKDTAAVNHFYHISGTVKWTSGVLNNTGDAIVIVNSAGVVIDSVSYGVTSPWPTTPNGKGASLMLCESECDIQNPANWVASNASNATAFGIVNGYTVYATPFDSAKNCSGCVGIEEIQPLSHIVIAPNPVQGNVYIYNADISVEVKLLDMLGNLVNIETSKENSTVTVNPGNIAEGLYFLQIRDIKTNYYITKKIVKY